MYKRDTEVVSTEARVVERRTDSKDAAKGVLGTAVMTFRKIMAKCQRKAPGFFKQSNESPFYTQHIKPALLLL